MAAAGDDEDLVSLDVSSMSYVSDDEVGEQQGEVSSGAAAPAAGVPAFSFTPGDHDLLVRLVKLAQKMKYTTSGGPWAEWILLHVSHNSPQGLHISADIHKASRIRMPIMQRTLRLQS